MCRQKQEASAGRMARRKGLGRGRCAAGSYPVASEIGAVLYGTDGWLPSGLSPAGAGRIAATNDVQAVALWLEEYRASPNTQRLTAVRPSACCCGWASRACRWPSYVATISMPSRPFLAIPRHASAGSARPRPPGSALAAVSGPFVALEPTAELDYPAGPVRLVGRSRVARPQSFPVDA